MLKASGSWSAEWGLIPFWAKDAKIAYSTINARAETVTLKPAFRAAFKARRCLIPADGFYEWQAWREEAALPDHHEGRRAVRHGRAMGAMG